MQPNQVWRLYPRDLQWETLSSSCFPDVQLPSLEHRNPELQYLEKKFFAQLVASAETKGYMPKAVDPAEVSPEVAAQVAEERATSMADFRTRAKINAEFAMRCDQLGTLATANRQLLREANVRCIDDAVKKAEAAVHGNATEKAEAAGMARHLAQLECFSRLEVLCCCCAFFIDGVFGE